MMGGVLPEGSGAHGGKMKRAVRIGFLAALMTLSLAAEESTATRKKEVAVAPKATATPKAISPQAVLSTTITEVLAQGVTLQPGASQQFFAKSDFSGADKVALGFYATSDQDLSMTNYLVWWAPAGAPQYVVTDYVSGKNFAFLNSGGWVAAPFGNQLMVEMRNNGTNAVTITQITTYAIAR
jgi:hypothetical protein